jgi:uncharacterized protein (DUF488 family)
MRAAQPTERGPHNFVEPRMSTPTRREISASHGGVYTIGHSNHSIEKFLELLAAHAIEAIADVRSHPYSRFNPQFSLKRLSTSLEEAAIAYLFLGRELGARSDDPAVVVDGKVDYGRLAKTPRFEEGLARVADAAASARVALLCAERDPLECHRAILVCPELAARGVDSRHIREDGRLESRVELETRLLDAAGDGGEQRTGDLFPDLSTDRDERVALAYRRRGRQIAFAVPLAQPTPK